MCSLCLGSEVYCIGPARKCRICFSLLDLGLGAKHLSALCSYHSPKTLSQTFADTMENFIYWQLRKLALQVGLSGLKFRNSRRRRKIKERPRSCCGISVQPGIATSLREFGHQCHCIWHGIAHCSGAAPIMTCTHGSRLLFLILDTMARFSWSTNFWP